jgi:hypothetical protein
MDNPKPDLLIFRIPDEDNRPTFVQIPMGENGNLNADEVWTFTVDDADDYNQLNHNDVVFAASYNGGSFDLARFAFSDGKSTHEHLQTVEGAMAIMEMLNDYMTTPPEDGAPRVH